MHSVNVFPELLPENIIERAKKLSSALIADGMKDSSELRDGVMDYDILPVDLNMSVVGTAMTIDTDLGDNFPIHLATYTMKPGFVMVIDGKNYKERCYLGDLIMSSAKAMGSTGIVIDGLVRDRIGAIELGLPVFSRGFMQRGPAKKNVGKINFPIKCGGVKVDPGDLIIGDADGVTVVPRDKIVLVLENAEKKLAYELNRRKEIEEFEINFKNGLPTTNLAPDWVTKKLEELNEKR